MDRSDEFDIVDAESVPDQRAAYHSGSISTNAPGVRPSFPRLMWKNRILILVSIVPTAITLVGLYWSIHFLEGERNNLGTLVFLPTLLFGLISAIAWWVTYASINHDAVAVEKGLLSPAIVSADRTRLICLANMSYGGSDCVYGLRAIKYKPRGTEQEVVCSSTFVEGDEPGRYASFTPMPLWWGSSDKQRIADCQQLIPIEMRHGLRKVLAKVEVPDFDRMLLIDESYNVIEDVKAFPPIPMDD